MSEEKQASSFMVELDRWTEANVISPLEEAANKQFDEELLDQIKKAVRIKVLESYRNGLWPKGAQGLISLLEEHEHIFELNLSKLPIDEQEYMRGRYALWRKFLESAVIEDAPIYTIV